MTYWSTQMVCSELRGCDIVSDFDPKFVHQGAVELRLGPQAALSADEPTITKLEPGDPFSIPPGQLAVLLTEEAVHLRPNMLAFISLKTRVKSHGLINVSGFHVDPGYHGRLKFWVYNSGNQPVTLSRHDPVFLIWFTNFEAPVEDPYTNKDGQFEITSENLTRLAGKLRSPSALATDLIELQRKYDTLSTRLTTFGGAALALFLSLVALFLGKLLSRSEPSQFNIKLEQSGAAAPAQVGSPGGSNVSPITIQLNTPAEKGADTKAPTNPPSPNTVQRP